MNWKDLLVVALIQLVIATLGLIYMEHAYPPMATYVQMVGGAFAQRLAPIEERLSRLEGRREAAEKLAPGSKR